jgi:flagellar hook assembly protein FlgD
MKKSIIGIITMATLVSFGSAAHGLENNTEKSSGTTIEISEKLQAEAYISNELLVTFKQPPATSEIETLKKGFPIKKVEELGIPGFLNITFHKEANLVSIAEKLIKQPNIARAEPNYEYTTNYIPSEPLYKNQWYLKKLNAERGWDTTKGEKGIVVAVLDGGVQVNHPDLKGQIYKPFNAVTQGTSFPPDDHATHVAGIISASLNGTGITGVAPKVKIIPVNVFTGESANTADIIRGIVYAADHGADIINFSIGGYGDNYPLKSAVNYARSKGVILIASAGNDDSADPTYPASYPGVLSISATDRFDEVTWFSNYGEYIDFSAPGEKIYSTITKNAYMNMDGTSMAAPIVSGTVALMLSKNPLLSENDVRDILAKSAVDLGDEGWDLYFGYGRIDIDRALYFTPRAVENLSVPRTFYIKGNNSISVSFTPYNKAKVSAYIVDSNGKMVKSFVMNKQADGSAIKVNWNGTDGRGNYLSTGDYRFVVKTTAGLKIDVKVAPIKVVDQIVFGLSLDSTSIAFAPNIKPLPVKFKLTKQAKMTATLHNSKGQLIQTLFTNKPWSPGSHYFYWSGKKADKTLYKDGLYSIRLKALDYSNNVVEQKATVMVDTKLPMVSVQSPDIYNRINYAVSTFTNNEAGTITSKIVNNEGQVIKLLTYHKYYNAGIHKINWDGLNQENIAVSQGNYQLIIEFADKAGNKVSKSSNWINVLNNI